MNSPAGFTVLVPNVFLGGSRRNDIDTMPSGPPPAEGAGDPTGIRGYNRLAARHEHVVAKYCTLLGASMAGIVAYEDRIAAAYLATRPEVRPGPLGCVGLSGGGCRAALLRSPDSANGWDGPRNDARVV